MSAAAEQWNHSPVCVQKNETEKEWEREGGRMAARVFLVIVQIMQKHTEQHERSKTKAIGHAH